jgi:hypothetical protein
MVAEQFSVSEHAGVGANTQRRTAKEPRRQKILFVLNMITSPLLYALSFLFLFTPVSLALADVSLGKRSNRVEPGPHDSPRKID